MAIAFKWGNSHNGGAGGILNVSTVTIGVTNKRFNNGAFTAGNLLIAAVLVRSNAGDPGDISVPDFTEITDNFNASTAIRLWAGWRISGANESGAYTATWTDATTPGVGWLLLNFSGVDQQNPIDVFAQQNNTTSTQTHPVPSIRPNFADDFWLGIEGRLGANVPDTPSAPLALLYDAQGNSAGGGRPEICSAGVQLTSTASTGNGIFTQAAFTQASQGISIGLRTPQPITVTPIGGGVGGKAKKRKKKIEQAALPAPKQLVAPRYARYEPFEPFDFEGDDETVILLIS